MSPLPSVPIPRCWSPTWLRGRRRARRPAARLHAALGAPGDRPFVVVGSLRGVRRGQSRTVPRGSVVGARCRRPCRSSLTIGLWLLDRQAAVRAGGAAAVRRGADAEPRGALALGAALADRAGRVAMLVMGDASARRSLKGPGYLDERRSRTTPRWRRRWPTQTRPRSRPRPRRSADELLVAGRAAWQVLAGAPRGGELVRRASPTRGALRRHLPRRDLAADRRRSAAGVGQRGGEGAGLPSGMSSSLAVELVQGVLGRRGRLVDWPLCLPWVLLSARSAALSMPFAIWSPCSSTALVGLLLEVVEDAHRATVGDTCGVVTTRPVRAADRASSPSSAPTAAGKSDLGVELALRLGGEVVNADSMQLYRGMDIGTAKLTRGRAARRAPPPARRLGRARTRRASPTTSAGPGGVADARRRGAAAVLVGGSGLYVRAALDDLDFPGHRRRGAGAAGGASWRSAAPRRCMPGWPRSTRQAAAAIPPSNGRRVVRALEVVELTGAPVHRLAARALLRGRRPCRSAWRCRGPSSTRRIERARRPDVGAGAGRTRYAAWSQRGLRDGPHREPGARLRPGAAPSRGGVHRGARPGRRRCGRPGGSPAARTRGSAATRASVLARRRRGRPTGRRPALAEVLAMGSVRYDTVPDVVSGCPLGRLAERRTRRPALHAPRSTASPAAFLAAAPRRRCAPAQAAPTAATAKTRRPRSAAAAPSSTVDPEATRAGLAVLRHGGNAVDAAVAAAATLGVTEPFSAGIGGGGFFVYYDATQREGAHHRRPRDGADGDDAPTPTGGLDLSTRRSPAGSRSASRAHRATWQKALRTLGHALASGRRSRPARRVAHRGFVVDPTFRQQTATTRRASATSRRPASCSCPAAQLPASARSSATRDLADTYERLGRKGVDWLYDGEARRARSSTPSSTRRSTRRHPRRAARADEDARPARLHGAAAARRPRSATAA